MIYKWLLLKAALPLGQFGFAPISPLNGVYLNPPLFGLFKTVN